MKSFREPPCNECPFIGCGAYHDECPVYKKYREEKDVENRERMKEALVLSYVKANHDKMIKEKFRKEKR